MKKIALFLTLAALACGGLFAATTTPATTTTAATTQVAGALVWVNGKVAVVDNGKTYYLEGIQQLVGFVDGLKEGAQVKAEGYADSSFFAPSYVFLKLAKLSFNGKDYAIAQKAEHDKKDHGKKDRHGN